MVEDTEVDKYTKNEQHGCQDTKEAMSEKEVKELNGGVGVGVLRDRCSVEATRVVERV